MSDILIVDDERDIRSLLADILADEGYTTCQAGNSTECMAQIKKAPPMLMVLDIWLKDSEMDGIDILKRVKREHPNIPVIIISGHANIEIAVAAIKQGAYDFVEKPFNIAQLMVVVSRAMEASRLRHENLEYKNIRPKPVKLIGASPAFKKYKTALDQVAKGKLPLLLLGPIGVGKAIAARYIHQNSFACNGPFMRINRTPNGLAELENMIADAQRQGQALGGGSDLVATVFIEEILEFPLPMQEALVSVLTTGQFQKVSEVSNEKSALRFIFASCQSLNDLNVRERFHPALQDILDAGRIDVPSLENRRGDIHLFAQTLLQNLHKTQRVPLRALSSDAQALLETMQWPGNIRQLKNVLEHALILGPSEGEISYQEICKVVGLSSANENVDLSELANMPLRDAREIFEKEYLLIQISRFGGNISKTSQFVGMERSALHRKMKSLGISEAPKTLAE